jgi:hypothetical protein
MAKTFGGGGLKNSPANRKAMAKDAKAQGVKQTKVGNPTKASPKSPNAGKKLGGNTTKQKAQRKGAEKAAMKRAKGVDKKVGKLSAKQSAGKGGKRSAKSKRLGGGRGH